MGTNKMTGKWIGRNGDLKKHKVMHVADKIDLDSESEVMVCETKAKKNLNVFADKKSYGANNWLKFLEAKPEVNASKLDKDKNSNAHKTSPVSQNVAIHPKSLAIKLCQRRKKLSQQQITKQDQSAQKAKEVISKPGPADHFKIKDNCERPLTRRTNNTNTFLKENKYSGVKNTIVTKQIAMDCEMVGVEIGVKNSILARISLVNALGDCIYDKYVKPTEPVVDYRTRFSGIRPGDLDNASDFKSVQKEVADLIKGKILVGHALKNDLGVLFLSHPYHDIRDTSKFQKFRKGKAPALKKLAKQYLGVDIQQGEHNSVQDALAAMQLYRMFRREWEASIQVKRFKKPKYEDETSKSTNTASDIVMNI